jgi:hypothetical protein
LFDNYSGIQENKIIKIKICFVEKIKIMI